MGDGELRFVGLDVQLNEDHLTSDYAKIVEGSGSGGELKDMNCIPIGTFPVIGTTCLTLVTSSLTFMTK